jgi:hypothetical protein
MVFKIKGNKITFYVINDRHSLIVNSLYYFSRKKSCYSHMMYICIYEVVSKSSRTLIFITVLMKGDERGGQDYTSIRLLHQSARDTAL